MINRIQKESILNNFDSRDIPLEKFITFCDAQLILTTIYHKFKKFNLLEVFPSDLKDHLENIYELNKKRNQNIIQQAIEINNELAENNIVSLNLKGTANVIDNLYSDTGERMIGDIDLLVEERLSKIF